MLTFAKVTALLAATFLLCALAVSVAAIPGILDRQLTGLRDDANSQATATRSEILAALAPAMEQIPVLAHQVSLLRGDATRIGDRVVTAADRRLAEVTTPLAVVLSESDSTLHNLDSVMQTLNNAIADARPAIQNAGLMTGDVRAALQPMMECHGNAGCWPSEVTGIMGGAKTLLGEGALTARYWRKETPAIAGNITAMTGNGVKITKPSWVWKVAPIAGGIVGGIIMSKTGK